MSKIEKWLLRRIFRKALKQGGSHATNLKEIQSIILETMATEFKEDSVFSLSELMRAKAREAHIDFHRTKILS